jgi:DEAD/DEAH box helicase domain-containing protein
VVVGYKMLEFHNHQNLGYENLHEPLRLTLDTESLWVAVPEEVLAVLGNEREDALCGMVHAFCACARMLTMAERSDLCGTSFHFTDEESGETRTALCIYDSHPGGLGYSAKAFEHVGKVIENAIALVERCRCRHGCPACVGSYMRDRRLIGWALRRLVEAVALPAGLARPAAGKPAIEPRPLAARIPWSEVPERWSELVARLRAARVPGADLLERLDSAERHGARLLLRVSSPGLCEWLSSDHVSRRLWQAICAEVMAPPDGGLVFEVSAEERERALRTAIRLKRRHDDLTGDAPESEPEANDKLASGYVLAGDVPRSRPLLN